MSRSRSLGNNSSIQWRCDDNVLMFSKEEQEQHRVKTGAGLQQNQSDKVSCKRFGLTVPSEATVEDALLLLELTTCPFEYLPSSSHSNMNSRVATSKTVADDQNDVLTSEDVSSKTKDIHQNKEEEGDRKFQLAKSRILYKKERQKRRKMHRDSQSEQLSEIHGIEKSPSTSVLFEEGHMVKNNEGAVLVRNKTDLSATQQTVPPYFNPKAIEVNGEIVPKKAPRRKSRKNSTVSPVKDRKDMKSTAKKDNPMQDIPIDKARGAHNGNSHGSTKGKFLQRSREEFHGVPHRGEEQSRFFKPHYSTHQPVIDSAMSSSPADIYFKTQANRGTPNTTTKSATEIPLASTKIVNEKSNNVSFYGDSQANFLTQGMEAKGNPCRKRTLHPSTVCDDQQLGTLLMSTEKGKEVTFPFLQQRDGFPKPSHLVTADIYHYLAMSSYFRYNLGMS